MRRSDVIIIITWRNSALVIIAKIADTFASYIHVPRIDVVWKKIAGDSGIATHAITIRYEKSCL